MTFGTTMGGQWHETLDTGRGAAFSGRTFCRIHMAGEPGAPVVGEIWATSDHAVEGHAHDSDEMLYVLKGDIQVNDRKLGANEVVFIPRGSAYRARVMSGEGAHILRIEFPRARTRDQQEEPEYDSRPWPGPLTAEGFPDLA